jgi:hypothetical protein
MFNPKRKESNFPDADFALAFMWKGLVCMAVFLLIFFIFTLHVLKLL